MTDFESSNSNNSVPIDLRISLGVGKFLIFCILLIPYITTHNLLFPYSTGRTYLFRILSSAGLGLCAYLWSRFRYLQPSLDKITIALLTLILLKIISGFFSVDVYHSYWSDYLRMEGIVGWVYLISFYFLLKTVLTQKKDWLPLLKISTGLASLSVMYILSKWALDPSVLLDRQTFTFGNPSFFGTHMLIHIGLGSFLYYQESKKPIKVIWGIAIALTTIGLSLSGTRAAVLGGVVFGIVTLILLLISKWKTEGFSKKIKIIIAILSTLITILFCIPQNALNSIPAYKRFSTTSINQKEIQTRLISWNSGLQGWKEKPLLGWGEENFKYVYAKYMPDKDVDHLVDRAHNILIELLATNGIIGLIAYLILFMLVFINLLKSKMSEWPTFILAALWIGLFIQNLFIFETINSYLYFIIIIALPYSRKDIKYIPLSNYYKNILIGLCILIFPIITWQIHKNSYYSAQATSKALATQKTNISDSFDYYKISLATDNFGNLETVTLMLINLNEYLQNDQIASDEKLKIIAFALEQTDKQLTKTPKDIALLSLAGRFFYSVKSYKPQYKVKAEEIVNRGLKINPNRKEIRLLQNKMMK